MTGAEVAVTGVTGADGRGKAYAICGAAKRQEPAGPCTRPAGWGTDHPGFGCCKLHGGKTPTQAARAKELQAEAEAAAAAVRLGLSVETNHVEALQDALNRAHADVLAWGMRVSQLDPEGWKQRDLSGKFEKPSVWVEGYWRALDRYAQIARDCTSLGIQAAAVDVVRREADQVQALLAGVLERLGHDWSDEGTRAAVAATLSELEAGA